jgi:hypothetical protein
LTAVCSRTAQQICSTVLDFEPFSEIFIYSLFIAVKTLQALIVSCHNGPLKKEAPFAQYLF